MSVEFDLSISSASYLSMAITVNGTGFGDTQYSISNIEAAISGTDNWIQIPIVSWDDLIVTGYMSLDNGLYDVRVTSSDGGQITATSVMDVFGIIEDPRSLTKWEGDIASFYIITSTPLGITYSWQSLVGGVWTDLVESSSVRGVTSHTLTIFDLSLSNNNQYRCIVSKGSSSGTSDAASLTVFERENETPECSFSIVGMQFSGATIDATLASNVNISGNIITGSTHHAIMTGAGNNNTVSNNLIYRCSMDGIKSQIPNSKTFIINNTIYKCDIGIEVESFDWDRGPARYSIVNNVIQKCSDRDTRVNLYDKDFLEVIGNSISDNSLIGLPFKNNVLTQIAFNDAANDDFSIQACSLSRMSSSVVMGSDPYRPSGFDSRGHSRSVRRWGSGALHHGPIYANVNLSVGSHAGGTFNGVATSKDGIITFSGSSIGILLGVGDSVSYHNGCTALIAEKMSESSWYATDETGRPAPDCYISDASTTERISSSLYDAFFADIETRLGSKSFAYPLDINVWAYRDGGSSDPGGVYINGWSLFGDSRIYVKTPYKIDSQVQLSQRHSGKWGDSGFDIVTNNPGSYASDRAIAIENSNVTIEGLRIDCNDMYGISIMSNSLGVIVRQNIIKNSSTFCIEGDDADTQSVIQSNVIYDCTYGITAANSEISNNTIESSVCGINVSAASIFSTSISNCIMQGVGGILDAGTATTVLNCISAVALPSLAFPSKQFTTLSFVDAANGDFHLNRKDYAAINTGLSISKYDIDSAETDGIACIGAHYLNVDTVELYFSCGKNTNDFKILDSNVSVLNSIATFDKPQIHAEIGVGNVVSYNSGNKMYIHGKIDESNWVVRDNYGEAIPDTVSSYAVESIKHPFNEIASAVSFPTISSVLGLGNINNPFALLSQAKYRMNVAVYKDSPGTTFVTAVQISGFYCDANNYLRIFTPINPNQANKYQRASYRNARDTAGALSAIMVINSDYTIIEGINIASQRILLECSNSVIDSCNISADVSNAIHSKHANIIKNNAIYQITPNNFGIISASGASVIINNSVISNYDGVSNNVTGYSLNGSEIVINCIADKCAVGYTNSTPLQYCNSSDSSAGSSNGCMSNVATPFVSAYSFILADTDVNARGRGRNIKFSHNLSVDATGKTRDRLWDIGAVEASPTKHIIYSVGDGNDISSSKPSALILSDFGNGRSIIKFSKPQINDNLGIGDVISFPNGETAVLHEKISDLMWYVLQDSGERFPTDIDSRQVVSISKKFRKLSEATQHVATIGSLVATKSRVTIACYKSLSYIEIDSPEISPINSDQDYFIKVFAPSLVGVDCNSSQSHIGAIVSLDKAYFSLVTNFSILSTNYVEIIGLQISAISGDGLHLYNSNGSFIYSNLISNCRGNGIKIDECGLIAANNLIYRCLGSGIMSSSSSYTKIYNNTVDECAFGISSRKSSGQSSGMIVKNCLMQNSSISDISIDYPGYEAFDSCIVGDDSLINLSGTIRKSNTHIQFSDESGYAYNLNPSTDFQAIDAGLNLSGDEFFPFDKDIAGHDRPQNAVWDIGCFEYLGVSGIGLMMIQRLDIRRLSKPGIKLLSDPTKALYLRMPDHHRQGTPENQIKHSISEINTYLQSALPIENIIIYVEGGQLFSGQFQLNDRSDRTVEIMTDPYDYASKSGPASLGYGSVPLVDDASSQSLLTFSGLKIYNSDLHGADYFIGSDTLSSRIRFVNCIIQVNQDSIIGSGSTDCSVEVVNSMVLYANNDDTTHVWVSKRPTACVVQNSSFLVDKSGFVTVEMGSPTVASNSHAFNYNGEISTTSPILVFDPMLKNIGHEDFVNGIRNSMEKSFEQSLKSYLNNAGNNSFVANTPVDILGNERIFNYDTVDIGPYEAKLHLLHIEPEDIRSVFQDKANDSGAALVTKTRIYESIYEKIGDPAEFCRGSKIFFELKPSQPKPIHDKINVELGRLDAYYDDDSDSIIVSKSKYFIGGMFGNIFDSSKYVFYFDETIDKLIIYLNFTYDKGLSGSRSIINNVRFGGPSIIAR